MPIVVTGNLAMITPPTYGFETIAAGDLIDAIARTLGRWAKQTAGAGSTTTMQDALLGESGGYWDDHYLKGLSGANVGLQQRVTGWSLTTHTATLAPARAAWADGDLYRLTSFNQEWCFSAGMVRGVLDQAIDSVNEWLFYEIANDNLVLVADTYEYSFRAIGTSETWIRDLLTVQARGSSTLPYQDVGIALVGDGSSFRFLSLPSTSDTVRLIGKGYPLRTNASSTVIASLTQESDRLIVERGKERIVIARAIQIMFQGINPPKSNLTKEDVNRMMAEALAAFTMKPVPIPFKAFF